MIIVETQNEGNTSFYVANGESIGGSGKSAATEIVKSGSGHSTFGSAYKEAKSLVGEDDDGSIAVIKLDS